MSLPRRDLKEMLADFFLDMVVFAELSDEDEMHPDTSVKWLENAVVAVRSLGPSDRLWLHVYVKETIAAEPHPDNRRVLQWLADEVLGEDE